MISKPNKECGFCGNRLSEETKNLISGTDLDIDALRTCLMSAVVIWAAPFMDKVVKSIEKDHLKVLQELNRNLMEQSDHSRESAQELVALESKRIKEHVKVEAQEYWFNEGDKHLTQKIDAAFSDVKSELKFNIIGLLLDI